MMWVWLKKYIWGGIIAIIAILALVVGIQTKRNKTLKAEANEAKKEAEKAVEQLQRNNEVIQQAEAKRKAVLSVESQMEDIRKETAAAVETVKQARTEPKATRHLGGKWIIVFAILFMASGCASSLTECRAKYPCSENVCIQVTPPAIPLLPRPQPTDVSVDYDSELNGYLITNEQFDIIEANEAALRATIEGYEKLITVYNDWRLRQ